MGFILLCYQKILFNGGDPVLTTEPSVIQECSYCVGNGYIQVLLGGTETCPDCNGTGKKEIEYQENFA